MYSTRRRVLKMLHDHTLDVEQAEELLESIEASVPDSAAQDIPQIIGDSAPNQEFLRTLKKIATMDSHVLVQGEPGTGKTLTARAIHAHSRRSSHPFLSQFCGESPDTLGAELFGVDRDDKVPRKGLMDLANGGTLFLDMVEDCPAEVQRRLSAYLEDGYFSREGNPRPVFTDVRLMGATHGGLKAKVDEGKFQSLLYYRLGSVVLQTPPLRDRPEDIPTLVAHFLRSRADRDGRLPQSVTKEAMELLVEYSWPDNVAQLAGMVDRALSLCDGDEIGAEHFPDLVEKRALETQLAEAETR
jgi:DNA-binding NtrC family response regulator